MFCPTTDSLTLTVVKETWKSDVTLEFFQMCVYTYENYIAYKPETEIGGSEGEKH